MRKKIYIAVCGLVDSGKSSFIRKATEFISGRKVNPDALCVEQETGKTIANTKISCPLNSKDEIVFIDCPGHLEYYPEIISAFCMADAAILIKDGKRLEESEDYLEEIKLDLLKLNIPIIGEYTSHSLFRDRYSYEIGEENTFAKVCNDFLEKIDIFTNDFSLIFLSEEEWGSDKKVSLYSEIGIIARNIAWLDDFEEIKRKVAKFDISSEKNISRRILICDAEDESKVLGLLIITR